MKLARFFLLPLVLAYFTIYFGFILFQNHLVFSPTRLQGPTPKSYHLDYQDVSFPAADGTTLNGWWIEHPQDGHVHPVLLYCHGNADDLAFLAEVSRIFYDFGFDEFLFDYHDYGKSGKSPHGLSEGLLDSDASTAYQWLRAKGFPESRIIIWGHSLGSSVAAWLATQTHPAGLILEGAFPSIYAVSRERYPWLFVLPFMVQNKFETGKYIQERTCPLLEVHAEKDTIIPIVLGEKVFEEAADPKKWLVIQGIDHNDFPSVARKYQEPIEKFVHQCGADK